jgi:hypothetical protein
MNVLFFGGIFVAVLLSSFVFQVQFYGDSGFVVPEFLESVGWPFLVLGIFLFNVGLTALAFTTLPGFGFFPLSAGVLLYRGLFWGLILQPLPAWRFLLVLPVVILEGEAYVLAATAGTVVGLSWMFPKLAYPEESLSRLDALRKALKECLHTYVLVVSILFAAALAETAILLSQNLII